jgi:Co/Zn/Cd efflux system component
MLSTLHFLMHPGCTCEDHGGAGGEDSADTRELPGMQEDGKGAAARANNLNLFAALLHLVADVLRGIVILVLACLIQLGLIQDGERADAYCAIIVAGLLGAGSLVLFLRAGAVLTRLLTHADVPTLEKAEDGQP